MEKDLINSKDLDVNLFFGVDAVRSWFISSAAQMHQDLPLEYREFILKEAELFKPAAPKEEDTKRERAPRAKRHRGPLKRVLSLKREFEKQMSGYETDFDGDRLLKLLKGWVKPAKEEDEGELTEFDFANEFGFWLNGKINWETMVNTYKGMVNWKRIEKLIHESGKFN